MLASSAIASLPPPLQAHQRRIKRDPTRTTVLRARYAADLRRDFRAVIRWALKSLPALYPFMSSTTELVGMQQPKPLTERDLLFAPSPVEGYKVSLQGVAQSLVMGPREGVQAVNPFLRHAMASAGRRADIELIRAGIIPKLWLVNRPQVEGPLFTATLERLSLQSLQDLRGLNDDLIRRMHSTLVEGFAKGWKPSTIAKGFVKHGNITLNRATRIARTQIVNAVADSKLDRFEQWGMTQVTAQVEVIFTTAGDLLVCPICLDLEGRRFTIQEARGVITGKTHPNCRCDWGVVRPKKQVR